LALAALLGCALAVLVVIGPAAAQGLFGDGDAQRREAETALRINQLEGQIRNLTGQVEEMGFQIKQLQDQLQKMQKDTDFRLQELENAPQPGRRPPKKTELTPTPVNPGAAPVAPSGLAQTQPNLPGPAPGDTGATAHDTATPTQMSQDDLVPPGSIGQPAPATRPGAGGQPQVLGAPPQILGQIPRSEDPLAGAPSDAPIDLGQGAQSPVYQRPSTPAVSPVPGVTPKYATVQPTPNARDEYDAAYGYIMSGEYELAERSFKTFLANHPTDRRAGSAQYWLGESYFQRNMHREATDAFLKSYTQYPDDGKAPDSLLKLGLAYQGLGERRAACNAYDELLNKYPKASKPVRDRAALEKTRGKCS
jgi:tol-pal system protein YbgF